MSPGFLAVPEQREVMTSRELRDLKCSDTEKFVRLDDQKKSQLVANFCL